MHSPETIRFYRKWLPHWEVAEGRYFVTILLKGAVPEKGQQRILQIRQQMEQAAANGQSGLSEYRMIFREMEQWLDRADTVDHLIKTDAAKMLIEAIHHRQKTGLWKMYAWVIMPNHIHMFFRLGPASRHVELDRVDVPDTEIHHTTKTCIIILLI